jgi:predicted small secreted protein
MPKTLLLLGFAALMALAACNTVAGAGQDVSHTAHWVQRQF